jgi:hypothetical protein
MSFIKYNTPAEYKALIGQQLKNYKNEVVKTNIMNKVQLECTDQLLNRNKMNTSLCRTQEENKQKKYPLRTYEQIGEISDFSKVTFRNKHTGQEIEDRLCRKSNCNFVHNISKLRKTFCILHYFNCCTSRLDTNNCCMYGSHNESDKIPLNINLCPGKDFKDDNNQQIFKIFYYSHMIRIYLSNISKTIVIHSDFLV